MGAPLGPKYLPYIYMDPLGKLARSTAARRPSKAPGTTRRASEFCANYQYIGVNWDNGKENGSYYSIIGII